MTCTSSLGSGEAQKSGVSWDGGTGRDVIHSDDGLHDPRCIGGGGCMSNL